METEPQQPSAADAESTARAEDARVKRLNTRVAITVALLATFVGICKVKDDNIVQAMQQAQADRIDQWAFYQARNIRQEVADATVTELELQSSGQSAAVQTRYAPVIARYKALVADQAQKKALVQQQALNDERMYDALNYRDDQFDLSDALSAIAIALLAVTSLTEKEWLFRVAMVPTVLGVLMGVAGLAGWRLHPSMLTALLS